MMNGVPLETCWAFNKLWNNKFYYKLHLIGISTDSYYDAWIHEYQTDEIVSQQLLCLRIRNFVMYLEICMYKEVSKIS